MGQGFQVSGQITPAPNAPNAGVSVELIPPAGPKVLLSTAADINGVFSLYADCSDITGAGSWNVQTEWAGDSGHLGATSTLVPLTVNQASSSLTLDIVMSEAIKINSKPPIGGNFSPSPFCDAGNLSGTPITLRITEPDTTEHLIDATTNQNGQFLLDYDATGFAFDKLGDWTIVAEFTGNNDYAASESDEITVRVVPTAGYAVIIQGKSASSEGLASHIKTTNFVYDKLIERQLLHGDIEYFGWDVPNPNWDALPSKTAIENAITSTVKDKMVANAGDLYIVMVNHGWTAPGDNEEGIFYNDPYGTITSSDLAGWINDLQSGLIGTPAQDQNIIVILGFCRAGAFMDEISATNRIIIASAAKDEYSHRGPQDVDDQGQPLREGEYFVSEFFKNVAYGKSVKQCFEDATTLVETFTTTGTGSVNAPYYDDSAQHPLLDDNGDGLGSNELSDQPGEDGSNSEFLFIGTSPATGNDPGDVLITDVTEAQFLSTGDTSVNLWAAADDPNDVRIIWIEVKAPDYDPGDPGAGVQIEMDTFEKPTIDYNNDRFEWNNLGGGSDPADLFSTPGTYQVFYFAKDNTTGHVSPIKETRVYKALSDNLPPDPFSLVSPADQADVLTTLVLDWTDATDPDDHNVTYTVLFSKDNNSFSDPIRKEGVVYSTCLISADIGIEDLSTYYWKVQAIDEYGAVRESDTRVLHTDNTNPITGWIEGHVYDSTTGMSLGSANVVIGGSILNTSTGGYYLGMFPPGVYSVSADASGYNPLSYSSVTIAEGSLTIRDFGMIPMDTDGDGILDVVETASGCLDANDADTDDDCIPDGVEDANQDGSLDPYETDPCDIDTDDDGIQDGTELGYTLSDANPDTNPDIFQPDLDPSTTTDPLDDDTDNDGVLDGIEDANHNGRVDPGETNPGISDAQELNGMPGIPLLLLFGE